MDIMIMILVVLIAVIAAVVATGYVLFGLWVIVSIIALIYSILNLIYPWAAETRARALGWVIASLISLMLAKFISQLF